MKHSTKTQDTKNSKTEKDLKMTQTPKAPCDNPVKYDETLAGKRFEVCLRTLTYNAREGLPTESTETVIAIAIGQRQWQYAGRGSSLLLQMPDGSLRWSTGVMGDCYIMRRVEEDPKIEHEPNPLPEVEAVIAQEAKIEDRVKITARMAWKLHDQAQDDQMLGSEGRDELMFLMGQSHDLNQAIRDMRHLYSLAIQTWGSAVVDGMLGNTGERMFDLQRRIMRIAVILSEASLYEFERKQHTTEIHATRVECMEVS